MAGAIRRATVSAVVAYPLEFGRKRPSAQGASPLIPRLSFVAALSLMAALQTPAPPAESAWPQWGGPGRDFVVRSGPLADAWPESGPPVVWSRALGTGHSAIIADEGRLFTLYRQGNPRGRQGPWDAEEVVVAIDAATGRTLWEHRYPSRQEDFSFGAGPHASPLVVGDRLFTIGTNQQMFAFDTRTGEVLWSHDFIADFGSPELLIRPVVKVGYGCSPIAYRDTVICSVGGPGQSVMAFRQSDGAVVWRSGDFLTSAAAPILIDVDGEPQAVFLAGGTITGLDPGTGRVLWSVPHDPGNDLNCGMPLWGPDNVLFVSSAYKAGSRALRLSRSGGVTHAEELWFSSRSRFMFLSAVRIGGHVYGTTGDFGPAFLTGLDLRTGVAAWQHRGFSRASLLHTTDGKTIVLDEDGDLALVRLSPEGVNVLAQAKIFDTVSWTVPTLVGTRLYARDREKIVALDLGRPGADVASSDPPGARAGVPEPSLRAGDTRVPVVALPARFAGSWKLDSAASAAATGPHLAGLTSAGAPPMLFITQPENGTLVVEGPTNEGQARFYRPGSSTATPAGQAVITMTTRWDGRTLVAEGTIAGSAGSQPLREVYSLSDDGALTIDVVAERSGRLRYVPLSGVGPCQGWPTPCKR